MENKISTNSNKDEENHSTQFSEQQLTIEIPTVPDMVLMNSPYKSTFPNHLPVYQSQQTDRHEEAFSTQINLQHRGMPGNCTLPNKPQMYIVDTVLQTSDGESDRSSDEDYIGIEDKETSLSPTTISSCNTSPANSPTNDGRILPFSDSEDSPQPTQKVEKKKTRTNYTTSQVHVLERAFVENAYPDSARLESLANDLNIAQARIKIWFQNKRARFRKRVQGKPMQRQMLPPAMPTMGGYGFPPPQHPMLHGSHFHHIQNPYFYPGYSFGMPNHHSGLTQTPSTRPITSDSNPLSSPESSLSSPRNAAVSPRNTEVSPQNIEVSPKGADHDVKADISKGYQPYSKYNSPQIHPYMPYPYPYGASPTYYC